MFIFLSVKLKTLFNVQYSDRCSANKIQAVLKCGNTSFGQIRLVWKIMVQCQWCRKPVPFVWYRCIACINARTPDPLLWSCTATAWMESRIMWGTLQLVM